MRLAKFNQRDYITHFQIHKQFAIKKKSINNQIKFQVRSCAKIPQKCGHIPQDNKLRIIRI